MALPMKTGLNLRLIVARRMASAISTFVGSSSRRNRSPISSSTSASWPMSSCRFSFANGNKSAGISSLSTTSTLEVQVRHCFFYFRISESAPFRPLVVNSLHPDQVHHAFELVLSPDRDLNSCRGYAKFAANMLNDSPWVCDRPIHFVYKRKSGDVVTSHLPINRGCLALHGR